MRGLDAPRSVLIAWLVAAVVSGLTIALIAPSAPPAVAGWHQAVDFGQMLLLGLIAMAACATWDRFGSKKRGRASAALFLASFCIAGFALHEDLALRAGKLAASALSTEAWIVLLALGFSVAPVFAAWLGRLARRGLFPIVAVLVGVLALVGNHMVLARNYPGVHLWVALCATTLIASVLVGRHVPWPAPTAARIVGVLLLGLGLASVAIRPSYGVMARAQGLPGSVLFPFTARLHAWLRVVGTPDLPAPEDREPVPPTLPPLVPHPVVVLVSVDCLRADVAELDAYRSVMPNLHAMREESTWFREVRTPAPATMVALSSVFSGKYFSSLEWGVYKEGWQLFPSMDPSPRLPELLRPHGVSTMFLHGTEWSAPDAGIVGAFEEHRYVEARSDFKGNFFTSANRLNDDAIARLRELRADEPFFLYMHWLEAHAPYDLGTSEGDPKDRYLAELAIVDEEIGRLGEALSDPALKDRAIFIVTADHGEAFGEHNTHFHAVTLYDEMVRVPLVARLPDRSERMIETPVSLMDIGPTVLDLFGADTPGTFAGQSLVPALAGDELSWKRPLILDSGRLMRAMVFEDGMKLIHDRRYGLVELYDLRRDPDELENLADVLPAEAEARLARLEAFFAVHELRKPGYETPFRPP